MHVNLLQQIRLISIGGILGLEDCYYGRKTRTTKLTCISQIGEVLEEDYSKLMYYASRIQNLDRSYNFFENYINSRENCTKELLDNAKIRYCMTENKKTRNNEGNKTVKLNNHKPLLTQRNYLENKIIKNCKIMTEEMSRMKTALTPYFRSSTPNIEKPSVIFRFTVKDNGFNKYLGKNFILEKAKASKKLFIDLKRKFNMK